MRLRLLLLTLALALPASANEVIVLERVAGDEQLAAPLTAELTTLGWPVQTIDSGQTLRAIGKRLRVVAVVRPNPSAKHVVLVVWAADRQTVREQIPTTGATADPGEAALHIVEILRARLVRLGIKPPPAKEEAPPPVLPPKPTAAPPTRDTPPPTAASEPLLWVSGAPSVHAAPGGISALATGRFDLWVPCCERLRLGATVNAPITSDRLATAQGSAEVSVLFLAGSARLSVVSQGGFRLWSGLGLGAGRTASARGGRASLRGG